MPRGQQWAVVCPLVLIVGVLLRGPAVLVRVGLLGLRLERAIRPNTPLAYWTLHVPPILTPSIQRRTCQALPRRSGGPGLTPWTAERAELATFILAGSRHGCSPVL